MGLILKGTIPRVPPFSLWWLDASHQISVNFLERFFLGKLKQNSWKVLQISIFLANNHKIVYLEKGSCLAKRIVLAWFCRPLAMFLIVWPLLFWRRFDCQCGVVEESKPETLSPPVKILCSSVAKNFEGGGGGWRIFLKRLKKSGATPKLSRLGCSCHCQVVHDF